MIVWVAAVAEALDIEAVTSPGPLSRGAGRTGTHLDPWLRTHERLGADIVKVAPESVVVTASVAEWEEWTKMALPESGAYVVSGALVPIEIDRERDEGVYVEPNVWMVHSPRPPNP